MLYRERIQLFADGFQIVVSFFTVVVVDANLDQFMCLEANVDFFYDGFGQAALGDGNDRVQAMGLGTQGAALIGLKLLH